MQFIHVRSLEKYHPGYKDRVLTWGKIFINMAEGDPETEMIENEIDWGRYVKIILLELRAQKPLPNNDRFWIRKGFDLKKRPMSLTLKMLHSFIDIVTEDSEVRNDSVTQIREEKIRKEEEKEEENVTPPPPEKEKEEKQKFREFVFLTKKEFQKLVETYGIRQANNLVAQLNDYIGSKGAKYRSHYYTIMNWARRDKIPIAVKAEAPVDERAKREAQAGPPDPETHRKIKELIGKTTERTGG